MKKSLIILSLMLVVAVAAVAATFSEIKEQAILGDREAMYQLSKCYMEGNGVAADYDRSDYWLERAAREGQPDAKRVLDLMGGKTELSSSKRAQLAAEEKRERERLLAERQRGNNGGSTVTPPATGGNLTFTVNGVSFTMVAVPSGTFTMGATSEQGSDADSDETPTHSVTLRSFYIGQTEVTQELWQAVMGENPSWFNGTGSSRHGTSHSENYGINVKRPVESVSWDDCQVFIRKLNQMTGKQFRLPTEAEWEYAARGGRNQGYKYSGSNNIDDVAVYQDNSYNKGKSSSDYGPHSVASKRANELGLYDMSGNVWEWCSDWYGSYSSSAQTNPTGPSSGSNRVIRGGGWGDIAGSCRVSHRCSYSPGLRSSRLGLRLAL